MLNNNKIFLSLILSAFLMGLFACQDGKQNTAEKPNNLVSPEKMQQMLSELHFVDALINQKNLAADSAKKLSSDYYDFIYRKYAVTANDFNNTFQYYLNNPADMDSIYVKVLENLNMEDLKLKKYMVDSLPHSAVISVDTNYIQSSKLNSVK
jgi:phage gp29-like protein